jgi:hypothetical protein
MHDNNAFAFIQAVFHVILFMAIHGSKTRRGNRKAAQPLKRK